MWRLLFEVLFFLDEQCSTPYPGSTPEIHGAVFVGGDLPYLSNESSSQVFPAQCGATVGTYLVYGEIPPVRLDMLTETAHVYTSSVPIEVVNGTCHRDSRMYNPQLNVPLGSFKVVSCELDFHCEAPRETTLLLPESEQPSSSSSPSRVTAVPRADVTETRDAPTVPHADVAETRDAPTNEGIQSHRCGCYDGHCYSCEHTYSDEGAWAALIVVIIVLGLCTFGLFVADATFSV